MDFGAHGLADFLETSHNDFESFPPGFMRERWVAVGFLVVVRQHGVYDFLRNHGAVFVVEVDFVGYAFVGFEELFNVFNQTNHNHSRRMDNSNCSIAGSGRKT